MRPGRFAAVLGLLCGALVSTATAGIVDVPASIAVETWEIPNPPVDPNRCVTVFFVQFADVPGGGVYDAVIFNQILQQNQTFTAGPTSFPDDEYTISSGQQSITFLAPAGTHRIVVGESSSGQGCQTTPAVALVSVTTEVADDKVLLAGTVTEAQCSRRRCATIPLAGVTVAVAGTESASVQTQPDGSYALELRKGDYVVTPSRSGFEFTPEQRTVALTAATSGVDFQACGSDDAGAEIRTLAPPGNKACFVVLRGQVQSAIDGAPFVRPFRADLPGAPLMVVNAYDKAGTLITYATIDPDGRFELKVHKGTSWVLRASVPPPLEQPTMLPRGGIKLVARRDRDDLLIRIRPSLVRLHSNDGHTGYLGDYLLELIDTRPFDGGPDVNGSATLSHARPGPDKLIPTCTNDIAARFPSPGGKVIQLFRVPVANVIPGEPPHDLPACPGEYKGEVVVGGGFLAKFVVRLTGGFQGDIPFGEVRYFGRFRR